MCYFLIDKFSCSHKESNKIPCEDMFTKEVCGKEEEDQIVKHDNQKCQRCLRQDEEEDDFEETLKRIAEDEKLAPVPKSTARDPNAPKLYFKRCIKWKVCGRKSCC